MASFGVKEIQKINFMPTFKINGQIYQNIDSLLFETEENPKFLQI